MTFVCKNSYGLKEDVESVIVRVQCVPPKLYVCGNGRSAAVLAAITVCNQRLFVPTKIALYTFNHFGSGGMVIGGVADVDSNEAFNEAGSGGSVAAGLAIITTNIGELAVGGAVVAGTAIFAVSQSEVAQGGVVAAGDGEDDIGGSIDGLGGAVLAGNDIDNLVSTDTSTGGSVAAGDGMAQSIFDTDEDVEGGAEIAGVGLESIETSVSGGSQMAGSADHSVINDTAGTGGSFIGGASEVGEIGGPTEGAGGTADIQYTANPPTGDEGAESAGLADEEYIDN